MHLISLYAALYFDGVLFITINDEAMVADDSRKHSRYCNINRVWEL